MRTILYGFIILSSLLLMANRSGRGAVSGSGATTAPGESGTYCGSFGCHFNGQFDPVASIRLLDQDSMPVTSYMPSEKYIIEVNADYSGNPAGFGFQMVALKSSDNSGIDGYEDFPSRVRAINISNRVYVEHSNTLEPEAIYIDWEAPSDGTGDIDFYAAVNVVNGNGSSSGDGADTTKLHVQEEQLSSLSTLVKSDLEVFPNPASEILNLQSHKKINSIRVFDLQGRMHLFQNNPGRQVMLNGIKDGMYLLEVQFEDNNRETIKLMLR